MVIPQSGDHDLAEERMKECLVDQDEIEFKIQDAVWQTSSSGKKTSCTTSVSLIGPEDYSVMIKKYIASSAGGFENSAWTETWQLVSADTSMELGDIYYLEHNKDEGTYTEYRYIEKIIAVRIEPGCEDAAQAFPDDVPFSDQTDFIKVPNPCR
jgi:hypothetical protein